MNRQQKIRLAVVLLAAALLGTAAGLNLPARVQGGGVVAAFSAFGGEVTENLFAVATAPQETGDPAETPAPPEDADFVIRLLGVQTETPRKRVLIYHTHTYEAYEQTPDDPYEETEKWRTADSAYNVVRVGEELAALLRGLGVEVVHDVTAFEPPNLSSAYTRSLEMLEKRQAAGEKYDLYIDLHRDAYIEGMGENTLRAEGVNYAKLMMLVGRGDNFQVKPHYEENYAFARALTDALNARVPGICRDVLVKTNRYNQHVGPRCLLIEAGNNKNTLMEALRSMEPLADSIAALLKEQ